MSSTPQAIFPKDAWHTPQNARRLRAYMALRNQEIAERIVALRNGRHLSQKAVYEALGVSERGYQNWERGLSKPNYTSLQKLAAFYGVTEGYILDGVDDRPVIEGVPEQLDGVDTKFSERVDDVEVQLATIETEIQRFRKWAGEAVQGLMEERALALARANERLVSIEEKIDRVLHLVDEGLFTRRPVDGGSRGEQIALGPALAQAFQSNPDALQALQELLQPPEAPARTGRARKNQPAG